MTARGRAATILLVEDDVTFGSALRGLLESEGHAIHQVLDGAEALRRVTALGDDLDVILLDLLLPKVSGFDVVKELTERGSRVPVLVMTGVYDDTREIRALRGLGVRGWIHKSAPFEHFAFRINALLHPAADDTRAALRVATSVPVQFSLGDRTCYAASYNLSATGIYVRTAEPVEPGVIVEMALALPTSNTMVVASAEIVHSAGADAVRGTAYPAGFGARFVNLSPLASAAIRRLVDVVHAAELHCDVDEAMNLVPAEACS